jgi:hypothetical protein
MRSRQLHSALTDYLEAAASHLRAEVEAGAEVPFDVGSQLGRGGRATSLYCYRALTGDFIAEREAALKRLPGHAQAAKLLEGFDGLDRYLAARGTDASRTRASSRARAAMKALLEDVFHDQTDFHVRPERVHAALERLEHSASAGPSQLTLVGTLHGLAISSAEIQLAQGLAIAQPDAIEGVPPAALAVTAGKNGDSHLLVVLTLEQDEGDAAILQGRDALRDLLRALRLFGGGRLALGVLGWAQLGAGEWRPLSIGGGGRPHGMLVVTGEQEDELRAFCNLVSRRTPHGDTLAWALRRFELGCERDSPHEALTDHLLALRALLEPEGPASGMLAGRVAALCATPESRADLAERVAYAVALERTIIAGGSVKQAAVRSLGEELTGHLRALLSDVICGHLDADLPALADELLLSPEESPAGEHADGVEEGAGPSGAEAAGLAEADEPPESPADELPCAEASEPPEAHAGESEAGESGVGESADADADELAQTTDAGDGAGKALEAR